MGGSLIVTGGRPLCGRARVPAAKNSVLPLLAAALLCEGPVCLRGVPRLSDVEACLTLLQGVGCAAVWQGEDLVIRGGPCRCALPKGPAAKMRASILFCTPLLARMGRAETVLPGGCRIGARPIDLHLEGLAQMGAIRQTSPPEQLVLAAPAGLHGASIRLRFPSVGATETLLLAAVCARGDTVLQNPAQEPEIVDLATFLNRCGACIQGAGGPVIRVKGRRMLGACSFAPMPDRIYASTLACAAAAAGGQVEVQGCPAGFYAPVLEVLEQMGCRVERTAQGAAVSRFGKLRGVGRVCTGVYPGLATDAAPLLAAPLLTATGPSCIQDRIFEDRFACAEGFARMGAQVSRQGRELQIRPGGRLQGAQLDAPDLRGGAALVLAALAAQGPSCIRGMEYLDRGYADLSDALTGLGAQVHRRSSTDLLQ